MVQRVQAEGNPDRVRRPNGGAKEDGSGDRAGSGVVGAAAQANGLVRPHLRGTAIYKMTGSGNDFVMLDARHTTPDDWAPEDIRAVCARGTGIGADGLVFLGPGAQPGSVRMIYFNADGSRAAMCGNAALCSTRLAARLGLAPPLGTALATDAVAYDSHCAADAERAELHLAPVQAPAPVPGTVSAPEEQRIALGTVGVPHLIVLVSDAHRLYIIAPHPAPR